VYYWSLKEKEIIKDILVISEKYIKMIATVKFIQPALPNYRVPFYSYIASQSSIKLFVFYAPSDRGVLTQEELKEPWSKQTGKILKLPFGLQWQIGAISVPVAKGDYVVISGAPRCVSNIVLLIIARFKGAKTIWWGHYWSATTREWRFRLRLQLLRLADAVLFYTDEELKKYLDRTSVNQRLPASALNNGLNLMPISRVRAQYLAKERPLNLFFIGRLTQKAQFSLLLHAMARESLKSIYVKAIGDGSMRYDLQSLAKKLGVHERIQWISATVDESSIAEVANSCRLFVYPGEVGLSLIHGMAYGLPAIVHSSEKNHMPEIAAFEDGVTGETFLRGSSEDLARVIHSLIFDERRLDNYSMNSLKRIEKSFHAEDMAFRFLSLIDKL